MLLFKHLKKCLKKHYFPELWFQIDHGLSFESKNKILVICLGEGREAAALAKQGWSVTGYDPSQESASYTKARFKSKKLSGAFQHGDLKELPFEAGEFDAVCALHAFERVKRPGKLMAEIRRVIKPRGKIFISSTNARSLWAKPSILHAHHRSFEGESFPLAAEDLIGLIGLNTMQIHSFKAIGRFVPFHEKLCKYKLKHPGVFVTTVSRI